MKRQVASASQEPNTKSTPRSAQKDLNEKPVESNLKPTESGMQKTSDTNPVPDVQISQPIAQSTLPSVNIEPTK